MFLIHGTLTFDHESSASLDFGRAQRYASHVHLERRVVEAVAGGPHRGVRGGRKLVPGELRLVAEGRGARVRPRVVPGSRGARVTGSVLPERLVRGRFPVTHVVVEFVGELRGFVRV